METKISKSERRWIWRSALFIGAITLLPYILGYSNQGTDWVFSGFFFGVGDGNSYIAKMLRGSAGEWLFRTPYTAYPQNGVLAFLPYYLAGKLASGAAIHEQLISLFQILRLLCLGLNLYAVYRFSAFFFSDILLRRISTILIVLGGGLGWLFPLGLSGLWQGGVPLEFYSPETFGFLAVLGLPHLAAARAFLLLGFLDYLAYSGTFSWKRLVCGGSIWIGLGLMQPLTVVVGWLMILLHAGFTFMFTQKSGKGVCLKRSILALLPACAAAPLVFYTYIRFATDPFLVEWTKQNLILSPSIGDYLLAWGGILPFAILGARRLFSTKVKGGEFLVLWAICGFFLAYAPYNLQRRLPEGVWVALVILGLLGIRGFRKPTFQLSTIWLSLGLLSSLVFFVGGIQAMVNPGKPLFRERDEIKAFAVLAGNSKFDDVVLASFDRSNALPAWAPVRTLIGHGPESIHLSETMKKVDRFFTDPSAEAELVQEFDIKYILMGPEQSGIAIPDQIDTRYQLLDIFNENGYRIYRVDSK